jgi:hypothetical protein
LAGLLVSRTCQEGIYGVLMARDGTVLNKLNHLRPSHELLDWIWQVDNWHSVLDVVRATVAIIKEKRC